jgi:alcohol dehydrogenase
MYGAFGGPIELRELPDPEPPDDGVVVRVAASGLCRSDWHGWHGHDPDIRLPHVPGHELAGTVAKVGRDVRRWSVGARVTVPFVCGCGRCAYCLAGDHQVCPNQTQPGFTHWGSLAEYVALHAADVNLVALPEDIGDAAAATLGCRFATAFRAVVQVGRVRPGEWVAVFGCGGLGLSAVHIAAAVGARVIAVDIADAALDLARAIGAEHVVNSATLDDPVHEVVHGIAGGGAHLSLDALGNPETCASSIRSLRRRGRHVQVGLLPPALGRADVPMELVIAQELEVLGSHGMAAHSYGPMLAMIAAGRLRPGDLVTRTLSLDDAPAALQTAGSVPGFSVVTSF